MRYPVYDKRQVSKIRFTHLSMSFDRIYGGCIELSECTFSNERVGYLETQNIREFFYAISYSAGMNLHIKVLNGENDHHKIEAIFKAFAKALDEASSFEPRSNGVLSTKGTL